jgi:hypothetical protein
MLRIAELIAGIGSGLVTVISFFIVMRVPNGFQSGKVILGWIVLYGLPCVLVITGAYSHSIRHKLWGLKLVWIIASLSALQILLLVFGGAIGYLGIWNVLYWMAPTFMFVVTGVIALVVFLWERVNGSGNKVGSHTAT